MGLLDRLNEIRQLDGLSIYVGIQGTEATDENADGITLAGIAAVQEYGSLKRKIPSRPWMRTTFDRFHKSWAEDMRKVLKLSAKGDFKKVRTALRFVGIRFKENMQKTLLEGPWVDNSPYTIKNKGSSKPLIDSSQLLQSHRAAIAKDGQVEVIG